MLMDKIGSLLVPQHLVDDQTPPTSFVKRLQSIFGPDLHVEWNPRRKRWVIEQCVGHQGSTVDGIVQHTYLCNRVYVWLVRDEADGDAYMPLCERVIEILHEMETYRKYGVGEAALARFTQESKDFDQSQANKQRENAQDTMKYVRRHNRVTWNKFWEQFRRFDMRPNK